MNTSRYHKWSCIASGYTCLLDLNHREQANKEGSISGMSVAVHRTNKLSQVETDVTGSKLGTVRQWDRVTKNVLSFLYSPRHLLRNDGSTFLH
jgi:hypothetical protein